MATSILASILFLIAAILHPTSGCSCGPEFREPAFCSLDYGIKGTIVDIQGNVTLQEDLIYSVHVQEVYHNTSVGIRVNETLDIRTSATSCGFHSFQEGVVYMIAGGLSESGIYSIESCSAVVVWYNDDGDLSRDIDIPCSAASMTTLTTSIVIIYVICSFIIFG